jgi:hypothetical protein
MRLQREHRRATFTERWQLHFHTKRLGAATLGVTTILVSLGMFQSRAHSVIEASEIRLVDASGKVRAELLMENDSPLFSLRAANGHRTALLMSNTDSSALWLQTPRDTSLTYMSAGPHAGLLIEGSSGRVTLRADSEGPSATVADTNGTSATLGRCRTGRGKTSANGMSSTASVVMKEGEDKVLWTAPWLCLASD